MTKRLGILVGTPKTAFPIRQVSNWLENNNDIVLVRDTLTLAAAPVGDTISLAILPWDTLIDPKAGFIDFDALGAGVTLAVGDVSFPSALAAATSAAAAGTINPVSAVTRANYFKPLWQILGYASLKAAQLIGQDCELLATIAGAAATGVVTWSLKGMRRG